MDLNFHLVKQVNPSKSAGKIKECFAKLTLSSSRKKVRPEMEAPAEPTVPVPSTSSTARKLFDDFLTDDESDTEANELNRIFLSKTTAKTDGNELEHRRSKSLSQRLEVSDSDETNCSLEMDEKCDEIHTEMEKLQISPTQSQKRQSSQPLFTDSQPTTTDVIVPIQQISSRLSSLDINQGDDHLEADAALEQILQKQKLMKADNEPCRISVYSISSSSLSNTLEDSDVVIISESDSESDYSYPVSSIHPTDQIESCTPSGSMAARLDAFFDNIPSLEANQGPELLVPRHDASLNIEEISIEVDEAFLEESIEICESPNEDDCQSPSPQKHPTLVEKIASQSPRRSPRNHPSSLPRTPQKLLPSSPVKIASPSPRKKLQTPEKPLRKAVTPKPPPKAPQKPLTPPPSPSPVSSPTPLQDLPDDSSGSDSSNSYRIEKINISAKIKIKLQISDAMMTGSPIITTSSSSKNTPRITQSTEPESPPTPAPEEPPAQEEVLTPDNLRHRTIQALHTSAIDTIVLDTPPPPLQPVSEIDEVAEKLLNQIYGDEWKTPDVVKTLKNASINNTSRIPKPAKIIEEDLPDFSKFHNSIRSDLESTRLPNVPKSETKAPGSVFKVPFTDRKVVRKVEERKCISERKVTSRGPIITPRIRNLCDSDSSDNNSDIDASSDDSWNDIFSYSSDDGTPTATPTTRVRKKKKNSSQDELIYLDLSSEVIKVQDENENPNANNDADFQDRLKKLLETCKAQDKPKIEATPKNPTKTKRKLFTPCFGDENEASPIKPDAVFKYQENDSISSVTLKAPLPAMFQPINKQLESVKKGKPIFSIRTPKTVSKKNKENNTKNLENLENLEITPLKTPKSSVNKSEVVILQDTPCNKYGFLQSLDVTVSKMFCHPDALIYKEKFKSKKEELAEKLNEMFKKKVFENKLDVSLIWNKKLISTAGRCRCSKKLGKRLARIELSEKVLTSADRLRCTLIHELCHAANWIYNGETGHGEMWKKWASRANAVFPELPKIERCHNYEIDYKYTYKCTLCGAKSHAHSKSKKVEKIRCSYCHGAIEIFLNKKDKDGNVMPTPVKEPTGFAKFVKDNYKKHKTSDRKHADVMKILSNEFASMKV